MTTGVYNKQKEVFFAILRVNFYMLSRIEETAEEVKLPRIKKPKSRRKTTRVEEKTFRVENNASPTLQRGPKTNELANVRCMECHCVGTVMKTKDGIVLSPNKVKKTLLELGGGFFTPNIKKVKPISTLKFANRKAKSFVEGCNQVVDNEDDGRNDGFLQRSINRIQKFREQLASGINAIRGEKKMELVKMMKDLAREKTKTPAGEVPEQFTGFLSDEFEEDKFWKSNMRFAPQ